MIASCPCPYRKVNLAVYVPLLGLNVDHVGPDEGSELGHLIYLPA